MTPTPATPTPARPAADVSPKVTASTIGAAAAVLLVWGVEAAAGIDVPAAVEAAAAVLVTFALGWLVPDRRL